MRRIVPTLLVALVMALPAAAAVEGLTDRATGAAEERWLVGFHQLPAERGEYRGHRVVDVNEPLRFMVVATAEPARLRAETVLDDNVRYVSDDSLRSGALLFTPNDPLWTNAGHYGPKVIGAMAAWDRTLGSTSVKVANIDTGMNKGHEEYVGQPRVLQGWDFVNGDSDPNDEQGSLFFGCGYHGTHTIGTSGGTIHNGKGVAGMSQHSILPVKALGGSSCQTSESILASSLAYAADQGAHVASNSWRWPYDAPALLDAIDYAFAGGVTIVSAAGNNGPCTNCVERPWKLRPDKVIIVASTDSADAQSGFSSEGPEIDVAAPGTSIISTVGGTADYATYSGTSMATPHVSGLVALVKALNPTWGYAEIDQHLKATAADLGPAGFDQDFGHGRIDADAATAGGTPPPAACGDGADNDGDGLTDYPADPGCTSSGDTDETDPVVGGSVHTHDIDHRREGNKRSGDVLVQVWAFEGAEAAASGVTVSVEVCKQGGSCATGSADTGADGSVTFRWSGVGGGTYTTTVTGMVKAGWTWDAAAGHAAGGNSETESV